MTFPWGPGGRAENLYGSPVLTRGNLSARLGLRYHFYGHREARGLMAEIGLAYRIAVFTVERYKLKAEQAWD